MRHGPTISHAAERAGVGVETVRFYERRGLIKQPPRPRGGGVRFYDDSIIERIRFIRQAQELGFSLREIKELLALRADPNADCSDVRKQAVGKRAEVDRKITHLQRIRAALDELIASCPGGGALRACTIMDALAGPSKAGIGRTISPDTTLPSLAKVQRRRSKGRTMRTAIFKVDGMHCDGCARTIEALVATEPGVRKVTVSYKGREARILFEPGVANEDRLADVIRRAGYWVADRS
ncbi:MAG: MerR family DNA-binding protein [Pseudolabrys sp.]|nr:MerR family DNA-binding protein [Pseudolabrys sp.]